MAEHAPLPYLAPAVQRGFGFFETALLVGRRAILWDPHVDRLLAGLARLELPAPSRAALDAAAGRAVDAFAKPGDVQSGLRLTWLAAGEDLESAASWRLDAYVIPIPESRLVRRDGSRAISLPFELQRDTPGMKSTSYFAAIQGGRLAKKAGADEGLFRGHDGRYLEGTTTGLAAWNGGTPVLAPEGVLPSVTAAAFLGGQAATAPIGEAHLRAGGILLGSLTTAAPLLSLDGTPCAQPAGMLERIRAFRERLLEDPALCRAF
ncbi:MAG TPA: aminotransferase class IV [Thermoanaerobaculia bacterium]|nr:aminotransferase class IV [Thermoanaerobaculia bacterium]